MNKKLVVTLASVVVLGVATLAGCGGSSTTSTETTTTSTQTTSTQSTRPEQTSPTSIASPSTPNTAVLDQYNAWASKLRTLSSTFSGAIAAQDYAKAADAMDAIGVHAKAGKALPPTGNATADTQWQNAMDDLSAASALGAPACRSHDTDKLMDATDLFLQATDHISAWVNQFV